MKILMVCLGNICRSPIAEGVMQSLSEKQNLGWQIDSAGTESFHIGEPPHPHSQKVCIEQGIDISKQRAAKFYHSAMEKYYKIYAMAEDVLQEIKEISGNKFDENKVELFIQALYPNERRSVTDPWYGGPEGYYEVYEEIRKGCEAIVAKLTQTK
jgi:protein-tyrosine phosphatase